MKKAINKETDRRRMINISRSNTPHDNTRASLSCRQYINFCLVFSFVTQWSEITSSPKILFNIIQAGGWVGNKEQAFGLTPAYCKIDHTI